MSSPQASALSTAGKQELLNVLPVNEIWMIDAVLSEQLRKVKRLLDTLREDFQSKNLIPQRNSALASLVSLNLGV